MQLTRDHKTLFNGHEITWFIGDINFKRAARLGCTDKNSNSSPIAWNSSEGAITKERGAYWEAWGSFRGKPYQLFAWFDRETREISEIKVLNDRENSYFCENNYKMLTK